MAAALLPQGARRIGGSVLQRTQAVLTSPAVAEERRRQLVRPRRRMYSHRTDEEIMRDIEWRLVRARRRMYMTVEEIRAEVDREIQKELQDRFDRLKPYQIYWEFIKLFPAQKIFNMVATTSLLGVTVSAAIDIKRKEKKKKAEEEAEKKVKEAEKKQQQ